ncbi:MAG: HPF/RaiA family ribosome-associated protein [Candidatus Shapirobacteria bacterium]|jgi:ribosome-associated translation inhibitor RaiA
MLIHIATLNFDLTDKIRELVDTKLSQKLDRLLSSVDQALRVANVSIEKLPRSGYKIKFDMVLPPRHQIFAENQHPVLTTALTGLKEQIEKQLLRYKPQ